MTELVIKDMRKELAYCEDEDQEKEFFKHLKYTRNNRGKKTNMIKESEHRLSILPGMFDKKKDSFNTLNGVISLRDGSLSGPQT